MRDSALSTRYSALLKLHELDAHRRRQIQREAALVDRLVDANVGELVAGHVAVTFDVFELRRQIALLIDPDANVPDSLGDTLGFRLQIEKVERIVCDVGEREIEVCGQLIYRTGGTHV